MNELVSVLLIIISFIIYAVIQVYFVTKKYKLKKERKEKYRNELPGKIYETTILLLIKNFFYKNSIFKNIFLCNFISFY